MKILIFIPDDKIEIEDEELVLQELSSLRILENTVLVSVDLEDIAISATNPIIDNASIHLPSNLLYYCVDSDFVWTLLEVDKTSFFEGSTYANNVMALEHLSIHDLAEIHYDPPEIPGIRIFDLKQSKMVFLYQYIDLVKFKYVEGQYSDFLDGEDTLIKR